MATITAQTLIANGLQRADMVNSPTGFIQNVAAGQSFTLLNAAISELYDILYEADSESYASSMAAFPTVASQSNYAILTIADATFYHLRGVDYFNGSSWNGLDRVNFSDRNRYPYPGIPCGYSIEGDNLTLYPPPAAVYSMRLYWVPNPPILAAFTDPIDLKGPWSEFIEKHFAMQCMDIADLDTTKLERDLYGVPGDPRHPGLANRIRSASKKRDAGKPIEVVDVQRDDYSPWNMYGGYWRG